MDSLIAARPGLSSLFREEINFEKLDVEACMSLLFRELERTGITAPFLADPSGTEYIKQQRLIKILTVFPLWGNARDIITLAATMSGVALKENTASCHDSGIEAIHLSAEQALRCTIDMIHTHYERRGGPAGGKLQLRQAADTIANAPSTSACPPTSAQAPPTVTAAASAPAPSVVVSCNAETKASGSSVQSPPQLSHGTKDLNPPVAPPACPRAESEANTAQNAGPPKVSSNRQRIENDTEDRVEKFTEPRSPTSLLRNRGNIKAGGDAAVDMADTIEDVASREGIRTDRPTIIIDRDDAILEVAIPQAKKESKGKQHEKIPQDSKNLEDEEPDVEHDESPNLLAQEQRQNDMSVAMSEGQQAVQAKPKQRSYKQVYSRVKDTLKEKLKDTKPKPLLASRESSLSPTKVLHRMRSRSKFVQKTAEGRLRHPGKCPADFEWRKLDSGGYRCEGGNHTMSDEEAAREN
ncbi:hypothetical protein FN846DRAFT_330752 [Sphaerosporella brunnea]|uniref:Uncharacterized protein n=1 Tax=Sphaerosporella brunnea TaxID=1250544 RepID=A0A5J5EKF5_9PEZI|nr:hypothetical protein FN846DRAFT_330752 [Sphaerosporella brunnea]